MAQAKEAILRQKIVIDRDQGISYAELSRKYGINYHTVRTLCIRFKTQGETGLIPNYAQCGRKRKPESEKVFRLIRLIKHMHPLWGVPYILTRIRNDYPKLSLQSIRHYQRRLNLSKDKIPKAILPKAPIVERPRQAHDEWEIDAKERIELASGQKACFLNITDAKTNAVLKAKAFPPR